MRVRVLRGEEKKYFYSTRAVDVQTRDGTLHTPLRALSQSELDAKARVPLTVPMHAPVSGTFKRMSSNDVSRLFLDNDFVENQIQSLENRRQRMQHSSLLFALFQPSPSAIADHLAQDKDKDKFLRMTLRLQQEAGMNLITVPWVGYSASRAIEEFKTLESETEVEPIFFLDQSMTPDEIKEVSPYLKDLVSSDRVHFIGLLHRPVRKTLASCEALWSSFKDTNAAIISAGIERFDENLDDLSGIHLKEFIVGDILLADVRRIFVGEDTEKVPKKPPEFRIPNIERTLRIFDKSTLTISTIQSRHSDDWIDDVVNELGEPQLKHILRSRREAETDKDKYDVLTGISKTHEYLSSQHEVQVSREFISKGETEEYLGGKTVLNSGLQRVNRGLS